MAVYTYAHHQNNVKVREWCDAAWGRQKALSEMLFPENKFPSVGLGKYKCGEQFIDDLMLGRAQVYMEQIEEEERTGKRRKVVTRKKRFMSLETNKNENYSEIAKTDEYRDYVDFVNKYYIHYRLFSEQLDFQLPVAPKASNLMCAKFKHKLSKAKQLVVTMNLQKATGPKKHAEVKRKNARIALIREAAEMIERQANIEKMEPKEEFAMIVEEIEACPKMKLLAPVILMMNHGDKEKDFDRAQEIYDAFSDVERFTSHLKLVYIKQIYSKAVNMIESGWLSDLEAA